MRFVNLDYLRASQSRYRAVVCTPGSLSAYRRTALMPILTAWRRQTFLGAPCHHSEDRALTNFILRGGHYTYYQRTALVYTMVPETYKGVCRMYLRWERGNVRESLVQLGYQMVGVADAKRRADVGQRRQHHVHRQRIERHDGGDDDDEFGKAHRAVGRGRPPFGIGIGQREITCVAADICALTLRCTTNADARLVGATPTLSGHPANVRPQH